MEDNRFIELDGRPQLEDPSYISWHLDQEDYLCDELIGLYQSEIEHYEDVASKAYGIFEAATDHLIRRKDYSAIGIPDSMIDIIEHSWSKRFGKHMFLYGRFDMIGGIDGGSPAKVIEFNADTCTMLPETMYWQPAQLEISGKNLKSNNSLKFDIAGLFMKLRRQYGDEPPVLLGTSLGHPDDKSNIQTVIDLVTKSYSYGTAALDLEEIVFSDEGVFIEDGDEYIPVDILLKLFPWDFLYNEEPGLLRLLCDQVLKDQLTILNPAYTAIWQNKRFLNYITQHFPNTYIAKSYDDQNRLSKSVAKSSHGRLGEEVTIMDRYASPKHPVKSYQELLELPRDTEGNYYQMGMFYTDRPSGFNVRCQDGPIINDDCEFYSHFIIDPIY